MKTTNDFERALLREKILSYPYERQVEILNYILRDSLLYDRDAVFSYYTDEVLTQLLSAIAKALKQNGYGFRCIMSGRGGSICEWASLSGAICVLIAELVDGGCSQVEADIQLGSKVQIRFTADGRAVSKESIAILNNAASIHGGHCLSIQGKTNGAVMVFPFIKQVAPLAPPSVEQLLKDRYSVVRILLHNLF